MDLRTQANLSRFATSSRTPQPATHPIHNLFLPTATKSPKVESLFFPKNWQLYFSVVYLFLAPLQQNSGHYIPFPQPENLKSRAPFFSPKNWQLYFSVVYLFLTPLQQNSGHYIPFPQPENLKSRVPFFSEKLATLLFSGLPLLGPSTAKLRPLHPIPTARKAQK